MKTMECTAASIEEAMAAYRRARKEAGSALMGLLIDFPNAGQVQATITGKSIARIWAIPKKGKSKFGGGLWDAKASELNALMREALEVAYA